MTSCALSLLLQLLLLLLHNHSSSAYYSYRLRIPNGDRVPNPCEAGTTWQGVGHQNPAGAGLRNPFGRDFAAAGHAWTADLCRKDSDGDGVSNGAELGDPDCVWRQGSSPSGPAISHPGLCPFDSTTCTNEWAVCPKKFVCPALDATGVYMRNFTLNETVVPANETTYICQAFELNSTADAAHMIGSRPIIRNKNVLHHMVMYGCDSRPPQKMFDSPQLCFMGNSGCTEMLNLWAFGDEGECFNENAGVLIGGKGHRYAMVELHWNNPAKVTNYKDSSGLSLYYTNNLRRYNQGMAMYGELQLSLPPKQPMISFNHTCPGACTKAFHNGTRYITWATIHMHQYGVRGRVALIRNGTVVKELVPMSRYDYNSPAGYTFNPPIEYRQGDEVKTECYFSTMRNTKTVFWGEDTNQEMCFAFLHYYPTEVEKSTAEKLGRCLSFGGMNQCMMRLPVPHIEQQCNITSLRTGEAANASLVPLSTNQCFEAGCHPTCRAYLNSTFWPSNACFDPKRARRMAEVLPGVSFLTIPRFSSDVIGATTMVLYAQSHCEQEIAMLEAAASVVAPAPQPTAAPTQPPMTITGLSSDHMLAIILVCTCLGFLMVFAALAILGMKLRGAGPNTRDMSRKSAYSLEQPHVQGNAE